jgi:DNA polymerase III epsilon subunit family exonuclease
MATVDRRIVFLDTETATVRGAPHLLEIGAVRVEDGEVVDRFVSLVRPQVPIEPEAGAIHGIGDEDVRDAPDAGEVLARFSAWVGEDPMAAHSARFDAGVIGFECVRWSAPMPPGPVLDTLKLARKCLPDAPDHKLETLCQHLDIEVDVRHRALPDAVSCWKVFEACTERIELSPERSELSIGRSELSIGRSELSIERSELSPGRSESSTGHVEPGPDSIWLAVLARAGARLTIASAAPRTPRLAPRLRPLEVACGARARVSLLYGEEDRLATMVVAPRLFFESGRAGYMEAECARSGLLKTYRLDRVRRVQPLA